MQTTRPTRPSKRAVLLAAAMDILARHPGASLDDVAAAAGVSRATLFRQFTDRDDLIRSAGLRALADLERALAGAHLNRGTAEARLLRLCEVLVPAGQRLRFVYVSAGMVDDSTLQGASNRLNRYLEPVIAAAVREGLLRSDARDLWFAEAFDALLFACWTAVGKGTIAPVAAPALLMRAVLHGFGQGRRS